MSRAAQSAAWLAVSARGHAFEARANAKRCRNAYQLPGPLRDAALLLADAHDECAATWDRAVAKWEALHGALPGGEP